MRLIFMGTPEFAVPSLVAVMEAGFSVVSVVTQPDRPRGRGMQVRPTPVKEKALELGLPVMQPERLSNPKWIEVISELKPEVIAVVAFGQFLPKALLDLPPKGCVNIHPSLLPLYRGASPIQQAILDGATETGVTAMYLDEGMDTGDIISQVKVPIHEEDDAGILHDRLAKLGADLLVKTLRQIASGTAERHPQDHALATVTKRLTRDAGRINWHASSSRVANQVRAYTPWPGAFTMLENRRIKILKAVAKPDSVEATPGRIVSISDDGLEVACGQGTLLITHLQPESSRSMPASSFVRGYRVTTDTCFT
ncbi:MAG: methionyl-tRNA formyltransferase [Firmicutes bacterium]|jgi:methionyl-tRNA formyltransferase|nr:methionyl-tRNA formyltransferase [Bacillota bacterium]